ncbi:LPS export ABC transporter periplasmic protein LptC [Dyadobacter sp. CY312]|uniref:LPS export ABC transporter periplasmic protein LptC n=1 Tax=Dyadobacter sp. CY312 TaxID=2907303 RepID=UPI001F407D8E|nr:LPS export ABC transporter periplasmic protein LptC [Dyadobacter sp. CY312]MCE7040967.1 LPS export ABC transporter periplasmic protein LptC [Dyadobacter sp. CY312]
MKKRIAFTEIALRKTMVFRKAISVLLTFGITLTIVSCEKEEKKLGAAYEGPVEEVSNVQIRYSEQGLQKVQMITPRSLTYSNQNKVFPDTVNINFFDPTGSIITRLRADSGHFDHASNVYIVKGHVRVIKSESQETLTTTELSWNPVTKKVFTDKALTVRNTRTSEITNAIGMDAEQDFTRIKFRKATGIYKFSGVP